MTKTKNNRFLKVAGLMLGVTMLATCVLSGTMAKYTSTGTAQAVTATAATWNINVGGKDIATYAFDDLTFTVDELTDGAKEGSYGANTIVPGTFGYAEVTVKNEGEVDAVLSITKEATEATNHSGLTLALLETAPEAATASQMTDATLTNIELNRSAEKKIYIAYSWDFDDANDNSDTTLQGTEINFGKITLSASQAKAN